MENAILSERLADSDDNLLPKRYLKALGERLDAIIADHAAGRPIIRDMAERIKLRAAEL